MLKPDIKESLQLYVNKGCPTGSFLQACLENDLLEAAMRADSVNRLMLHEIAGYIYHELPGQCHGSRERVAAWLKQKRKEREEKGVSSIR